MKSASTIISSGLPHAPHPANMRLYRRSEEIVKPDVIQYGEGDDMNAPIKYDLTLARAEINKASEHIGKNEQRKCRIMIRQAVATLQDLLDKDEVWGLDLMEGEQ